MPNPLPTDLFPNERDSFPGKNCRLLFAGAAVLLAIASTPGSAETRPNTSVSNTAMLQVGEGADARVVRSNTAVFAVGERLDLRLDVASDPVLLAQGMTPVALTVTNMGNGEEAFRLDARLDRAAPGSRIAGVAMDRDGNGRFDPQADTALPDLVTPVLAPGASLALVVMIDTTGAPAGGMLQLGVRAVTGSGQSGTVFVARGDGGVDAVVGTTGASAQAQLPLFVPGGAPVLVKSQSVRAPDGSDTARRDAIITYTLQARFAGAGGPALVSDAVPVGTTYVANSLRLDDAPLSDAGDADDGRFGDGRIAVALPATAGPVTRTIRFQVRIN